MSLAPSITAAVVARDRAGCVVCRAASLSAAVEGPVDAVAVYDARLWPTGDPEAAHAVTVCAMHGAEIRAGTLVPDQVQAAAGLARAVPPALADDGDRYDRWGNVLLRNGTRLRGPLFDEPDVQAALAAGGWLGDFTIYVKVARVPHLPWSPGMSEDDLRVPCVAGFVGQEVVVTEKMDGENSSLYSDGYFHARSLDGRHHPSQSRIKQLAATMCRELPAGWRLQVENVSARHTIAYTDLESYFPVVAVWTDQNVCVSWDETVVWAELLGLPTVPVLYRGVWDEARVQACYTPMRGAHRMEGYVVRLARGFRYAEGGRALAKYVDTEFVAALDRRGGHWASQAVEWNSLQPRTG